MKDSIWETIDNIWVVACYCFVLYAIWRQEWTEGTFWLVWLILTQVRKGRSA
jgi:hypothetical protein